jgi:hypothetical protein
MRPLLVTALAVAALAASAGQSRSAPVHASRCGGLLTLPPATSPGEQALFGQLVALGRKGGRFVLRFDPSWHVSGYPAEQVMLEKTGSRDVPNDSVVVDETHRLLSFVVPAAARVTVLSRGTCTSATTVAALAAHLKDHAGNGFWIRVSPKYPSPVLELDEQYHP